MYGANPRPVRLTVVAVVLAITERTGRTVRELFTVGVDVCAVGELVGLRAVGVEVRTEAVAPELVVVVLLVAVVLAVEVGVAV